MALIQFGALVTQARGSVGGHTFDISKGGATLRKKRSNVRCDSQLQMVAKNQLLTVASAWRGLTASQVLGWNVGASVFANHNRFGQVTKLSGMALFYKLNLNLLSIGQPINLSLPVMVIPSVPTYSSYTSDLAGSNIAINFLTTVFGNDYSLVKASPIQSIGISFNKSNLRNIVYNPSPDVNIQLIPYYNNVFGIQLYIGAVFWVSVQYINAISGISSRAQIVQVVVS